MAEHFPGLDGRRSSERWGQRNREWNCRAAAVVSTADRHDTVASSAVPSSGTDQFRRALLRDAVDRPESLSPGLFSRP